MENIRQITIIGLGLIGGSIGLALKSKDKDLKVYGVGRRKETIIKAEELKAIDKGFLDPKKAVLGSDLVVVATPIESIIEIVFEIIPFLKKDCLITDTGSSKEKICSFLSNINRKDVTFIGSHPLAGSHLSGISAAFKDLFKDNPCIITPYPDKKLPQLEVLKNFWRFLGAEIYLLNPKEHDEIISLISHLPHILASSLVNMADRLEEKYSFLPKIIPPSFKEMTRIAASNPSLWREIILSNREMILLSLSKLREKISFWEKIVKGELKEEIEREFRDSKLWKEKSISNVNSKY